jgi:hypothetical protein
MTVLVLSGFKCIQEITKRSLAKLRVLKMVRPCRVLVFNLKGMSNATGTDVKSFILFQDFTIKNCSCYVE